MYVDLGDEETIFLRRDKVTFKAFEDQIPMFLDLEFLFQMIQKGVSRHSTVRDLRRLRNRQEKTEYKQIFRCLIS